MLLESRSIPLDSIAFSSHWNLHPWELYTIADSLSSSFSSAGVIHPPILLARDDNRFEIVCGFKRLLFLFSNLQQPTIDCLILAKSTDPAVILDIALTDQGLARPLSIVEKAKFLKIGCLHLQQRVIVDAFFDRLALDRRPSTLSTLLEILNQHPLLISEIHGGRLQDKVVAELLRLSSAVDRLAMVKLFKKLCMGDGKQRKFLPVIRDLASLNNLSVAEYLETSTIQEILEHPNMNNPQKIQRLASFFLHQINPRSTNAEIEFRQKVNSLKLPQNCSIAHSPSFEKDEVTISITFNNYSQCRDWIPTLKQALTTLSS